MSSRRGFLLQLGALAAAAVLDPEKLLWRPGEKKIFVPPVTGWPENGKVYLYQFSFSDAKEANHVIKKWELVGGEDVEWFAARQPLGSPGTGDSLEPRMWTFKNREDVLKFADNFRRDPRG